MDMIERIARAISLKIGQSPEIDGRLSGTGNEWIRYRKEAEAAVEAFLNPPKIVATEMIERGAKAIWENSFPAGPPVAWADVSDQQKDLNYKLSHAVIEAMREPTDEMVAAGWTMSGGEFAGLAEGVYQAMIDAALGNKP